MNVILVVKQYVIKMIEDSGFGMKVFFMDKEMVNGQLVKEFIYKVIIRFLEKFLFCFGID